jgi:hypothetical protein
MVVVAARFRGETEKTTTEEAPICFRNAHQGLWQIIFSLLLFQWYLTRCAVRCWLLPRSAGSDRCAE